VDYQPLELKWMQECGSALLKSLQNYSMIPLDLLVRESIQNSLDAGTHAAPVKVSFDVADIPVDAVCSLLGGPVSDSLRARFGKARKPRLVIRDTNTEGLTGPLSVSELRSDERHGNFMKLVYEIGRSQDKSDKGGSWGLGKTVYYRVGVGLVFYYSRVADKGGKFQERLAACLVEDERSNQRLQQGSQTGIAWWGEGKDRPVLDSVTIGSILQKLQVNRFTGSETGTAVIVPFLRSDLGPPSDEDDETALQTVPWWYGTYSDYIAVAVQRWYGIRLNNKQFSGPALEVSVDGQPLEDSAVLPIFRLVQRLHRCCQSLESRPRVLGVGGDTIQVEVHDIASLRGAFESTQIAGRVAIALVSHEQLGMLAPHNHLTPHVAIAGSSQTGAAFPIVAFLRGHGMIVRWDTLGDSAGWARGVGTVPEGKYLVAVVVPYGHLPLHAKITGALKSTADSVRSLEGYLRSCEKADHHQWTDHVGVTIVKRMKERVAELLKPSVPNAMASVSAAVPMHAARTIADRLLPEGFGTDGRGGAVSSDSPPPADTGPGRKRAPLPRLQIQRLKYRDGGFSVDWNLTWSGKPAACVLRLLADTEQKPMTRQSWENDSKHEGLGAFPFVVRKAVAKLSRATTGRPHDWTLAAVAVAELPGVQLNPKGTRLPAGREVVCEGTLDVDVADPSGAPIRAVVVLEPAR
jgi:hypothetical protein